MLGLDVQTGEPVFRVGGTAFKQDPAGGGFVETNDIASVLSAPEFQKKVGGVQEEMAALAHNKRIIEKIHQHPEAFSDWMAAASGLTPHWMSDRIAKAALTPEQYGIRVKVLKEAAKAIHELYGAALTAGEEQRAYGFLPSNLSTNELIISALSTIPEYASKMQQSVGAGVYNAALANGGMTEDDFTFSSFSAAQAGLGNGSRTGNPAPGQAPDAPADDDIDAILQQYLNPR
jgi:hypothetical protein